MYKKCSETYETLVKNAVDISKTIRYNECWQNYFTIINKWE